MGHRASSLLHRAAPSPRMGNMAEPVLIELDDRRRCSLGRIGNKDHRYYLVTEEPDGTLIWKPAVVMPAELAAQIEQTVSEPASRVRAGRPVRR